MVLFENITQKYEKILIFGNFFVLLWFQCCRYEPFEAFTFAVFTALCPRDLGA